MNGESFVEIMTILIALLGAVITYIIIPYIKSKTTYEQQKNIGYWVKIAVFAAEQIFNQPKMGEHKKQYVIDFLNSKGIGITEDQLDILIEAAVYELNKAKGLVGA